MFDEKDVLTCIGSDADASEYHGSILPPIAQASLFRKSSAKELHESLKRENKDFVYSRGTNPTVKVLEERLAALERGEACKCFASGIAAISAVFMGLLKAGDHILFINNIYGPTIQLAEMLDSFGITHTSVLGDEITGFEDLIRPETALIYFESPGTMLFDLVPIAEIVSAARKRGILTCIDNSVSTPLFQKPLNLGVDLVVHSCTKYIGGHSDVVGGALITNNDLLERIFFRSYLLLGGIMSPHDAWLMLRGLMSLPNRLKQVQADALEIAKFLDSHPGIRKVHHPLIESNPLLDEQMTGHTGLFSAEIDVKGFDELCGFVDRLELFGKAVSWGGVESLVIPSFGFDDESNPTPLPTNLVRFSIGLEGAETLISDLESALE
ncbi:MAG: aminotransferase class I/II-fold pyridoxal phosphate-dependent enzyme [Pyrinomonadaceae bacterium]|nr:aminotransferase class I/II-fold pyridoxal phosphate-dependent enzyme [Pyrinomonadaceae bacterium]